MLAGSVSVAGGAVAMLNDAPHREGSWEAGKLAAFTKEGTGYNEIPRFQNGISCKITSLPRGTQNGYKKIIPAAPAAAITVNGCSLYLNKSHRQPAQISSVNPVVQV